MVVSGYSRRYQEERLRLFRKKLGLGQQLPGDGELVDLLLATMEVTEADFTQTFRQSFGSVRFFYTFS